MSAPSAIGPYQVLEELGRGGMGAVYRAHHPQLDRQVALKVMLDASDPDATRRFLVEARALAQLQHPNFVPIHDVGHDAGRPFLAMDLIDGCSLDDRLDREGPLDPRAAAELIEQLARALDHAHRKGILHRDLKPANVLVDRAGRPLVTDFGLAKDLTQQKDRLTKTGAVLGTPAYMPPEQADGDPSAIDGRADVYSLGATLYALLTGEAPFKGSSPFNIIAAVLTKRPPPPSQLRADLPRDLETICLKCLEKEPPDRYGSAAALADDLGRYLRDEPILAQPLTWQRRLRLWKRRNARAVRLTTWVGGATVVVLVGGLAAVELWPRLQPKATVPKTVRAPTPRKTPRARAIPQRTRDLLLLGLTAADQKDWKQAVEKLEAVLRGTDLPADQRAEPAKRFVEACRELYFGKESDPNLRGVFIARMTLALEHRPDERECRLMRAVVCLRQPEDDPPARVPRLKLAVSDLTELLRAPRGEDDRFQCLLNRGKARRRLGQNAAAVRDLSEALELRPRSYEALFERGTSLRLLGRLEPAAADLARSIEVKRQRLTHLELCLVRAAQGDHERARVQAERAIEIDEAENVSKGKAPDPRAHVELAEALRHLKRYGEAKQAYLRARNIQARKREPVDPRIVRGLELLQEAQ